MHNEHRWFVSAIVLVAVALSGCYSAKNLNAALVASRGTDRVVERFPMPFTQMRVQINGGTPGRFMLARVEDGVAEWLAADGLTIWTRHGRIIATDGLRDDLFQLYPVDDELPISPRTAIGKDAAIGAATTLYAQLPGDTLGLIVVTKIEAAGPPSPVVVGDRVRLLHQVRESAEIPDTGAKWVNDYWFDAEDGTLEITRQQLPGVPYEIRMERIPEKRGHGGASAPSQSDDPGNQ